MRLLVALTLVVVPRAEWDPHGTPGGKPNVHALDTIVVHHTDFADAPGPRAVLEYHLRVSRFSDIGYHFVIAADGAVYEGRPLDRVGAHAGAPAKKGARDPDLGAIGIALDGYFADEPPPRAQLEALEGLVADLRKRFRIRRLVTHREVDGRGGEATECPGDALQLEIMRLRVLDRV